MFYFFRLHFRPKSPVKSEIEEEEVFNVLSSSSLSLVVEDLNEPANELLPVSSVLIHYLIKYYYTSAKLKILYSCFIFIFMNFIFIALERRINNWIDTLLCQQILNDVEIPLHVLGVKTLLLIIIIVFIHQVVYKSMIKISTILACRRIKNNIKHHT